MQATYFYHLDTLVLFSGIHLRLLSTTISTWLLYPCAPAQPSLGLLDRLHSYLTNINDHYLPPFGLALALSYCLRLTPTAHPEIDGAIALQRPYATQKT